MSGRILVLGAAGRLGAAASKAFLRAGWTVKGLVRPGRAEALPRRIEAVEAVTRDDAVAAAQGCDVVLNALNPVITEWDKNALSLAYGAIAAAEGSGATLLFPGSVWNYGRTMLAVLDEHTPMVPSTRKGRMRVEIEHRIREACDHGMRAIVLRAGDFFGGGRGSWFDLVIAKDIERQQLTYPGPLDVEHAWAYLPDYAACWVRLAEQRHDFHAFAEFGFPGHAVTGAQMIAAIEDATRSKFNLRRTEWWLIKTVGQLTRMGREIGELEYLWRVPHRIAGDRLAAVIGEIPHTPLRDAVRASLREAGQRV